MQVHLGNLVETNERTSGVVSDVGNGYALVRLTDGPELDAMDRDHGRWYGFAEITEVTGHDEHAMVWRGQGMAPAGPRN